MDPGVEGRLHADSLTNILRMLGSRRADGSQSALVLNVLLLGDKQSGRSSVGNALIGQFFFVDSNSGRRSEC